MDMLSIVHYYMYYLGIVPKVKAILSSVLDEHTEFVRLRCVWDYDGNASLVEFHVRWIGNESDPQRQINKMFSGTDEREYLYEHEYAGKGELDPPDNHDYTFNEEVCTILCSLITTVCSCQLQTHQ